MMDVYFVFVTFGSMEQAVTVTRTVVEEQLAAGGNLVPGLRSFYRWKGEVRDDAETMVIYQCRAADFEALRERIRGLHSYECPEIVAFEPVAGHAPYLDWVRNRGA